MIEIGPTLCATLGPFLPQCGGMISKALEMIGSCKCRAVQLSAAMKGLRPRELDTSSRKELSALIARRGLMVGGVDLMIPRNDWLHSAKQDRAAAAAVHAVRFAADMGRVPLSVGVPIAEVPPDIADELISVADGCGVKLAIHNERNLQDLQLWLEEKDQPFLGAALDPATMIGRGHDVNAAVVDLGRRLLVARLDDFVDDGSDAKGRRCLVGNGELDVMMYRASLSTCESLRSIVIDLRDLPDPQAGLLRAIEQWQAVVG